MNDTEQVDDKLDVNQILSDLDSKSGATNFRQAMLVGLNNKMHNIYGGTVDPVTVQERRAKNKRARKARRINRNK